MSWKDVLHKKSKARRKSGSKRAKKKGRKNRKSDKRRDACYYKVKSRYKTKRQLKIHSPVLRLKMQVIKGKVEAELERRVRLERKERSLKVKRI